MNNEEWEFFLDFITDLKNDDQVLSVEITYEQQKKVSITATGIDIYTHNTYDFVRYKDIDTDKLQINVKRTTGGSVKVDLVKKNKIEHIPEFSNTNLPEKEWFTDSEEKQPDDIQYEWKLLDSGQNFSEEQNQSND